MILEPGKRPAFRQRSGVYPVGQRTTFEIGIAGHCASGGFGDRNHGVRSTQDPLVVGGSEPSPYGRIVNRRVQGRDDGALVEEVKEDRKAHVARSMHVNQIEFLFLEHPPEPTGDAWSQGECRTGSHDGVSARASDAHHPIFVRRAPPKIHLRHAGQHAGVVALATKKNREVMDVFLNAPQSWVVVFAKNADFRGPASF